MKRIAFFDLKTDLNAKSRVIKQELTEESNPYDILSQLVMRMNEAVIEQAFDNPDLDDKYASMIFKRVNAGLWKSLDGRYASFIKMECRT